MTAAEIIALRTGADEDTAGEYASLAGLKVREFLRYEEDDDITRFTSTVADVGVLYYQRDTQVSALSGTAATGLKSSSFSEGNVSESKSYLTAGDLFEMYDTRADKVLDGIKRYRRAHVVTGVTADADEG